jgi:hypothetical protein
LREWPRKSPFLLAVLVAGLIGAAETVRRRKED